MKNEFIEIPACKNSIANRHPVFGVGVNDADYHTNLLVRGKKIMCPLYRRWADMLKRCYSLKYQKNQPTYIDCSVCDEWLVFSNFKRWMEKQDWQGKELDKDIINPGNKIYSPENCSFVDRSLNSLLNDRKSARGKYPQGVTWHEHSKKLQARVNYNGKCVHLGYYLTPEGASDAYIKAKVKIILETAKCQTDDRITNGLLLHADLLFKG